VESLMPYLHLPVQSGSDRILKAMNRKHSAASYLAVIERARAARPDIAISGDFIVGFPGESDAEFEETLQIIRDTNYAAAFSFKYSPRPGTPAATMEGQIEPHVADERLKRLQALIGEQSQAFNQARVGERTQILIERKGRREGQMIGKSPWLQSVYLVTDAVIGDMLTVDLVSAGPNSLEGALVELADAA
jgi:tRNA-2-methylthio-N6-dimethylallyladenosine synthase